MRRSSSKRRWGQFFALLAALLAIAVVAVILLEANGGQPDISPVTRDDVQSQIQGVEDFLRDNSR